MIDKVFGMGYTPAHKNDGKQQRIAGGPDDLIIKSGMTVDYVLEHGTEVQKLFANTFDFVSHKLNGKDDFVYNRYEADVFNNFKFEMSEQKNEITLTNKKTNSKIVFKFDDISDIENFEPDFVDEGELIQILRDTSKGYENLEFDLRNKTVTFSNQQQNHSNGQDLGMFHKFNKVIFNNCERMFDINASEFKGKIVLNNVHDKLFGINRRTLVHAGEAEVTSNSEIKLKKI